MERLLSAAVLRLDPAKVEKTLDARTPDGGGSYDPFADGAPLTLYATGVRVGYDMLWHSNGRLYTAVNGSAAGSLDDLRALGVHRVSFGPFLQMTLTQSITDLVTPWIL